MPLMPSAALQYDLYRIIAPLCAVLLAVELAVALGKRRRSNAGTPVFLLLALLTVGFLVTNTLEISSRSEAACYGWSRAMYVFLEFIPATWLMFSVRAATGRSVTKWWIPAALLVIPVVTLVIILSDRLVYLVWPSVSFRTVGGYVVGVWQHGPWFWVNTSYAYAVSLLATAITLRAFVLRRRYYRNLSVLVLLGVLTPIATNLLYLLRPIPGLVKDFTPVGYAVGATLYFVAFYRHNLFTIVPVARDQLIERLRDGIVVIDGEQRVVDINPAAFRMLGLDEKIVGRTLRAPANPPVPAAVVAAAEEGRSGTFSGTEEGLQKHYSVDSIPLHRRIGTRGRLVVIRDETKVRELLARVETMAREDALTGLHNRRAFMEDAAASFSLAVRHAEAACAAMFDLDKFKAINDEHGHAAGDLVLQRFSRVLARELRDSDIVGRYGGEEFAAVLPHTSLQGALHVCERVRARFEEAALSEPGAVPATVSAGVALLLPGHKSVETLLAAADAALYEAKAAGRNCVRGPPAGS